jgi:hypothetical protein
MKRLWACILAVPIVLLATTASHVRADFMNWSYTTNAVPPVLTSGTGSVQLTGITDGKAAASIPILGIQDSSAATPGNPDHFNSAFKVALQITDNSTNASGTLNLSGTVSGNLTATSSSAVASFSGPSSLTLGGHVYTVSTPSLNLANSGTPQQTLMANISVADAPTGGPPTTPTPPPPPPPGGPSGPGGGGGVNAAPEPASLVLGGLGWSLLGIGGWWKRRRPSRPNGA